MCDYCIIIAKSPFTKPRRSTRCEQCVHPTNPYDHVGSKTYVKNGTVTQHVFGSGPCISMLGYEDAYMNTYIMYIMCIHAYYVYIYIYICYEDVEVGPMRSKRQAFWEIVSHQIPVLDQAKFAAIVGIGPNFAYDNTEETLLMSFGINEFSVCLQKPRYIYIYIYTEREREIDIHIHIYIYIYIERERDSYIIIYNIIEYVHIHIHIHVYIYIYIHVATRGSPGFLTWGQTSSPQFKEWYFATAKAFVVYITLYECLYSTTNYIYIYMCLIHT